MPRTSADFGGKPFVLQVLDKYTAGTARADAALPEAYTCFFMLKIPPVVHVWTFVRCTSVCVCLCARV